MLCNKLSQCIWLSYWSYISPSFLTINYRQVIITVSKQLHSTMTKALFVKIAPSIDTDQPEHLPSLFRIYTVHMECKCQAKIMIRLDRCQGCTESLLGTNVTVLYLIKLLLCNKWAISQENLSSGFTTRSDTNWALQPQKRTRDLKF